MRGVKLWEVPTFGSTVGLLHDTCNSQDAPIYSNDDVTNLQTVHHRMFLKTE